jgi:flagellar biosynthetic protein FlhB
MAEVDGQEKTEQPSEKKIRETREKGSVAKSMEINSFAIFLAGTTAVYITKGMIGNSISEFAVSIFGSLNSLTVTSDSLS